MCANQFTMPATSNMIADEETVQQADAIEGMNQELAAVERQRNDARS